MRLQAQQLAAASNQNSINAMNAAQANANALLGVGHSERERTARTGIFEHDRLWDPSTLEGLAVKALNSQPIVELVAKALADAVNTSKS